MSRPSHRSPNWFASGWEAFLSWSVWHRIVRLFLVHTSTLLAKCSAFTAAGWVICGLVYAGLAVNWTPPCSLVTNSHSLADWIPTAWNGLYWFLSRILELGIKWIALLFPSGLNPHVSDPYYGLQLIASVFGQSTAFFLAIGGLTTGLRAAFRRGTASHLVAQHTVIIGLGGAGAALLQNLSDPQDKWLVLGIDLDPDRVASAAESQSGALILVGNAEEKRAWHALSIHRARHIFISTGSDSLNIEIAGRIRCYLKEASRKHRTETAIVPLVVDRILLERIHTFDGALHGCAPRAATILPFNSDDEAIRRLFEAHPIGELARLTPAQRAHFVILGFGNRAENLLLKGLQAALRPDLKAPMATVLLQNAAAAKDQFLTRYPGLDPTRPDNLCRQLGLRIRFRELETGRALEKCFESCVSEGNAFEIRDADKALTTISSGTRPSSSLRWPTCPVTAVFICLGKDEENLAAALELQRVMDRSGRWQAPTFVNLRRDTGLADSLAPCEHELQLIKVIDAFGLDTDVCTQNAIFESPQIDAAQKLHQAYIKAASPRLRNSPRPLRFGRQALPTHNYEELDATYQDANAAQNQHIPVKLRSLGYRKTSINSRDTSKRTLSPPPLILPKTNSFDLLARAEHDRWMLERAADGWEFGVERDNVKRLHNLITDWNNLSDDDKAFDRNHIDKIGRGLPAKQSGQSPSGPQQAAVWRHDIRIGVLGPIAEAWGHERWTEIHRVLSSPPRSIDEETWKDAQETWAHLAADSRLKDDHNRILSDWFRVDWFKLHSILPFHQQDVLASIVALKKDAERCEFLYWSEICRVLETPVQFVTRPIWNHARRTWKHIASRSPLREETNHLLANRFAMQWAKLQGASEYLPKKVRDEVRRNTETEENSWLREVNSAIAQVVSRVNELVQQEAAVRKSASSGAAKSSSASEPAPFAVTLVMPLWGPADHLFLREAAKTFWAHNLRVLVPRPTRLLDAEDRAFLFSKFESLLGGSQKDQGKVDLTGSWIIDLFPPGLSDRCALVPSGLDRVPSQTKNRIEDLRIQLLAQQRRRAAAYVIDRSDLLVSFPSSVPTPLDRDTQGWIQDRSRIPGHLRVSASFPWIPSSLSPSATRSISCKAP